MAIEAVGKIDFGDIDDDIYSGMMRLLKRYFTNGMDNTQYRGGLLNTGTVQTEWEISAIKNYVLGTKMIKPDGREFIYAKAGATGLGKALMHQSSVSIANYYEQVQTAYGWAIGATSGTVLITTGATPTANLWTDGWMCCNKGVGLGQLYKIATNTAHATIPTVTLYDPIVIAIAAASEISIIANRFAGTIVCPVTTLTARPVGVPLVAVTALYYYWSQVKGPAPMTVDTGDTIVIGEPVGSAGTNAVAGAVGVGTTTEGHYGRALTIGTADETAIIDLDLGL